MKKNNLILTLILALTLPALSCRQEEEEKVVVASAYDYNLYASDIQEMMPREMSPSDSVVFVQNYINHWMQERVLLHYANQNLHPEAIDIERQIENYKNSLLIYHYQTRYVRQNLDTIVTDEEISEYYHSHLDDFQLKNNIVKVMFIKLDNDSKNIKVARKLLKQNKPEDRSKLTDLAERFSVNYFLDNDVWILFEDLLKEVPIKTYNHELFLKNAKYVEVKDSAYTTLVRINGFKIKDNVSPLSFEYERIRMIILNKRKQTLIRKLEEDIYKKAREEGTLKIYENSKQ